MNTLIIQNNSGWLLEDLLRDFAQKMMKHGQETGFLNPEDVIADELTRFIGKLPPGLYQFNYNTQRYDVKTFPLEIPELNVCSNPVKEKTR